MYTKPSSQYSQHRHLSTLYKIMYNPSGCFIPLLFFAESTYTFIAKSTFFLHEGEGFTDHKKKKNGIV